MYRFIVLALLTLAILPSCEKNKKLNTTPTTVDSLVIHRIWGYMPYGYGHRTFMLTQDNVWEDTAYRQTDTTNYNFNKQLPDAKFNMIKDLRSTVPAFMLQEPKVVIYGDLHVYADGTATYVIAFKNGVKHTCLISDVLETVPASIKPFAEKVKKAYNDLQ